MNNSSLLADVSGIPYFCFKKMRKYLLSLALVVGVVSMNAQEKVTNNVNMENKKSTLRFIYPQWQGGIVDHWMPDIPAEDSSRGYYLGAQLLNYLAPQTGQNTVEVPVSLDINDRATEKGISARSVILKQTKAAFDLLKENHPDRIVTLGGECSVSVVPFTYLANKYKNDVAMIWIDAHPDITLPGDIYSGYHAMAVTACMGYGEKQIISTLPAKIEASKILFVGLRNWERDEIKVRQKQYGIKDIPGEEVTENSNAILNWLKSCGASKVVIHFDMDVLDPAEIVAAVGTDPNGMKIAQVIRVINDIAKEKELVGLTVAEAMPRTAIRIKSMLEQLPLLK